MCCPYIRIFPLGFGALTLLYLKGRLHQLIATLGGASPLVLLVVLVITAGVWAFIALADEIREGDTLHFDDRILRTLRKPNDPGTLRGPHWVYDVTRDITSLGSVTVLVLTIVAVLGYLLITHKRHAMWLVLGATISGVVLGSILKLFFARARPTIVPHLQAVGTASFPSGHSMYSAIVYLTLASLLARLVPERGAKIYFIIVALVLTFLIGLSRVMLGVHYPTDVLGGWCAGVIWALICWLIANYLQRHGAVENDKKSPEC